MIQPDEYKLNPDSSGEKPTWILQRHLNPDKKETHYQIWVKDDSLKCTPIQLAQMLADVIAGQQNGVKHD